MSMLQLVTKQFQPLCPLFSLRCGHLSVGAKIVSRHLYIAKSLDYENDKRVPVVYKYELSRSVSSQASAKLKTIPGILEIQHMEPERCKRVIFHLVSSCLNLEEQTGHNDDPFMILYGEYKKSEKFNHLKCLQQNQERVLKTESFQVFLEWLQIHFDNIGVEDLIDIFGGLLLLGVPETDSLMTQLFCKFWGPDVEFGFSEIAKLAAIFDGNFNFNSRHILQFGFVAPAMISVLGTLSSYDRNDLIYLSRLMNQPCIKVYPEIMDAYFRLVSDAIKKTDFYDDMDDVLTIINGICDCFKHEFVLKHKLSPDSEAIYGKIVTRLGLLDHQLSGRQVSSILPNICYAYWKTCTGSLKQLHHDFFKNFRVFPTEMQTQILMNADLFDGICSVFDQQGIMGSIKLDNNYLSEIIKHADELTLLNVSQVLVFDKNKEFTGSTGHLKFKVKARLLALLHARFSDTRNAGATNFQKLPYYPYFDILNILQNTKFSSRDRLLEFMVDFKPYLVEWLESGYACDNQTFLKIFDIAFPLLDVLDIRQFKLRIEAMILSTDGSQFQFYKRCISFICQGLVEGDDLFAETIQRALATAISRIKPCDSDIIDFSNAMVKTLDKAHLDCRSCRDLRACVAKKLENIENGEEYFLNSLGNHVYLLTEDMANRVLRYYAKNLDAKFDSSNPEKTLIWILYSFKVLSRRPVSIKKLKMTSPQILEFILRSNMKDSPSLAFGYLYIVYRLSYLDIYLDLHIRRVFKRNLIPFFLNFIGEEKNKIKKSRHLAIFLLLNRNIVLHRPDLHITWMCDHFLKNITPDAPVDMEKEPSGDYVNRKEALTKVLGGPEFFRCNVAKDYGVIAHCEFFLDRQNRPIIYKEANRIMDLKKNDIKKFAVVCGLRDTSEDMTTDKTAISVLDEWKIRNLKALEYEVVFIPYHEFYSLDNTSERYEYIRDKIPVVL